MRWLIWSLLFGFALAPVAWKVSDRLERNNDFCNDCHLPNGTPLHQEIRENFDRVIPVSLDGVHRRGWVEEREDTALRCIDCHAVHEPGGDPFAYFMSRKRVDAECRSCHSAGVGFPKAAAAGRMRNPR